jgi:hypothetical protein
MTALTITTLALIIAIAAWVIIAQRRHIDTLDANRCAEAAKAWRAQLALLHIETATRHLKSGTARKVHRMAQTALGGGE